MLSSVQSHLFLSLIGARTLKMPVPYRVASQCVESYTRTPSHHHLSSAVGAQITSPGRVTSLCLDYLHADVSDGGDLSLHQQEVTDGQLVTENLVPGTVDSGLTLECHLCCPSPLPTPSPGRCPPWTAAEDSVPRD